MKNTFKKLLLCFLAAADWQGYIAVFEDGRQTPKTVTDIPTETLNNVDREKLKTGIEAGTREELLSLLEDLSS